MSRLQFTLQAEAMGSRARAGRFTTLHNTVETPVFMPVGTHATVRGQPLATLQALEYPVLLANTYHLMLRPGAEVFRRFGGIQRFMNWQGSVLTDSGGFQIFSLPQDRQMSEEGALFRSYVDGQTVLLTPELSIEVQRAIGSDIMMVLDQCIPSTAGEPEARVAMELTHRWAKRSLAARGNSPQSLFAIVQGACFPKLRNESADFLTQLPFDGFAIGGLAVGETKSQREDTTEETTQYLPRSLPRYLMGVGTPIDILEAVHRGIDMFDCILPAALGQQGVAFTARGKVDLRRGTYKFIEESLDPGCGCVACTQHSMGYLHHLIRLKEALGKQLVAAHNLAFYAKLMREIRGSIREGRFLDYYRRQQEALPGSDREFPVNPPKRKAPRRPVQRGVYEVHETRPGVFSIRHAPSGEVMHSVNDPSTEARTLYVEQSRFLERLQDTHGPELVIWDVGLGAAINAMSVISAYEQAHIPRPVHIVSFENDLDSLHLALRNQNLFAHLRHAAPVALLRENAWRSKTLPLRWTLFEGDFQDRMHEAAMPDLIFFDPFSPKTDTGAWTVKVFKDIFQICGRHPTELFTYSSSTAVRAALLGAGFFVARGVPTGPREETTVAMTPTAASRHPVLTHDWLARWERSDAKFPRSVDPTAQKHFEATIRTHPQFQDAP